MKVVLRIIAVLLLAAGAFLIYAVIAALGSEGGARPGVAIGYVVGAALLAWAAFALWRRGGTATAQV